ncbi:hypothetical protein D3C73_1368270 [compost metagenome]
MPAVTSSAVTITPGSGIPAAAIRRSASSRGAEVTMAHCLAGKDRRNFAAPATSKTPSTSSISASVIHAASASASTPGKPRRLMVSMARAP